MTVRSSPALPRSTYSIRFTAIRAFPSTGAPYQEFDFSPRNSSALYIQDQIKLGRFTLVLSGRNDWVSTSQR